MSLVYDYVEAIGIYSWINSSIKDDALLCQSVSEYVYLIYNKDNSLYKIGITKDFQSRFRGLVTQSGCSLELVISIHLEMGRDPSNKRIESFMHTYHKSRHVVGEWFSLSSYNVRMIGALFYLIDGYDVNDCIDEHFSDLTAVSKLGGY
jgi:hypothetical protein